MKAFVKLCFHLQRLNWSSSSRLRAKLIPCGPITQSPNASVAVCLQLQTGPSRVGNIWEHFLLPGVIRVFKASFMGQTKSWT